MNEALEEEIRDRNRQLFTQNERLCAVEALVEAGRQLSRLLVSAHHLKLDEIVVSMFYSEIKQQNLC